MAVHHQHRRLLEGRHEKYRRMRVMMADLHDLRQLLSCRSATSIPIEVPWEWRRSWSICAGGRLAEAFEACRNPLRRRKHVSPKRSHLPRRRDDIDIATQALDVERCLQRAERKFSRMLLAVEPFFLQDDVGMPSLSSARPESWVLVTMPRMFTTMLVELTQSATLAASS